MSDRGRIGAPAAPDQRAPAATRHRAKSETAISGARVEQVGRRCHRPGSGVNWGHTSRSRGARRRRPALCSTDGGAESSHVTTGRGLAAVEPAAGDFAQRPPRLKADPPSGPSQCGGARPGHADVRALTPAVRDRIQADCRRGPAALPPLQRQREPRVYRAQHRCGASCGFLTDTRRVGATLNQRNLDPQHPLRSSSSELRLEARAA